MANATHRRLSGSARVALIIGAVMLLGGSGSHSWLTVMVGLALLGYALRSVYSASRSRAALAQPWPWPPDFRAMTEAMARPVDPTPQRILPPDAKSAMIAHVATSKEALARLIADKPRTWPWAVFTSVLLQRRNDVQARLRAVASGYQPRPGLAPITGQAYTMTAYHAMSAITDYVGQLEQFMLSPGFTGVFGAAGDESSADHDGIVSAANRMMDYHEAFLAQAESCLQTPVNPDVRTFVADMGAFTLCPLVGYEQFFLTLCARIGEAQDLLPYTTEDTVVALDDATLSIRIPDGLSERITGHIKSFSP